jgi:co-chaperonin GroES (HSP10)
MIKPIGAMLLVKENQVTDRKTSSGLVISAAFADAGPKNGIVIDMGPGEVNYKGDLIPVSQIKVNDIVYYQDHTGTEIEDDDGTKYLLINSKSIIGLKI